MLLRLVLDRCGRGRSVVIGIGGGLLTADFCNEADVAAAIAMLFREKLRAAALSACTWLGGGEMLLCDNGETAREDGFRGDRSS